MLLWVAELLATSESKAHQQISAECQVVFKHFANCLQGLDSPNLEHIWPSVSNLVMEAKVSKKLSYFLYSISLKASAELEPNKSEKMPTKAKKNHHVAFGSSNTRQDDQRLLSRISLEAMFCVEKMSSLISQCLARALWATDDVKAEEDYIFCTELLECFDASLLLDNIDSGSHLTKLVDPLVLAKVTLVDLHVKLCITLLK